MKLSGIKITNFRIFENQPIDFKPITFITGANSSGKSSVFKALMLLQENIKNNQLIKLEFAEGEHILGDFDSVKNRKLKDENQMSFVLQYFFENKYKVEASFVFDNKNKIGILSKHSITIENTQILDISFENEKANISLNLDWFIENEFKFDELFEKVFVYDIFDNSDNNIFEDILRQQIEEQNISFDDIKSEDSLKDINYLLEAKEKEINENENKRNKLLSQIDKSNFDNLDEFEQKSIEMKEDNINQNFDKSKIEYKYDDTIKSIKYRQIQKYINNEIKNKIHNFKENEIKGFFTQIFISQLNSINNFGAFNFDSLNKWQNNIPKKFQNITKKGVRLYTDYQGYEDDYFRSSKLESYRHVYTEQYNYLESIIIKDNIFRIEDNIILKEIFETYFKPFINLSQNTIDFKHLPANRGKQERIITFSKNNDALETAIKNYDSTNELQTKFVNTWLRNFEIGESLNVDFIESSSVRVLVIDDNNNKTNIADLGLGISQLIPIILACASAEKNTLLLLEEPETNLHPKFQSLLAEMFVDANEKFGVQFALETHSEYLIRKVQVMIANKNIASDIVKIYYFGKNNLKKSEVKTIDIYQNGKLSDDFGEGFFDMATDLQIQLMKTKNKK